MEYKQFDANLHKEHDQSGKDKALEILLDRLPCTLLPIICEGKFGVDIMVIDWDNDINFYVEVEVRKSWRRKNFPFECLYIVRRKGKFAKLEKPTLFFVLNSDCSSFVTCTSNDVNMAVLQEHPNKEIQSGEYFYRVPLESIKHNDLSEVLTQLKE